MNVPKVMKKYHEMVCPNENGEVADEFPDNEETPDVPSLLSSVELRKIAVWIGSAIAAIVIVIALIVFLFGGNGSDEGEPAISSAGETEDVSRSEGERDDAARPTENDFSRSDENLTQSEEVVVEKFTLKAIAREQCWLYATIDQSRIRDVFLNPDDILTLSADHEIHLVVGNAGGLILELGEDILDSLGPPDKPVTLVIEADGIKSQRLGSWHVNYDGELKPAYGDSISAESGKSE